MLLSNNTRIFSANKVSICASVSFICSILSLCLFVCLFSLLLVVVVFQTLSYVLAVLSNNKMSANKLSKRCCHNEMFSLCVLKSHFNLNQSVTILNSTNNNNCSLNLQCCCCWYCCWNFDFGSVFATHSFLVMQSRRTLLIGLLQSAN